VSDGQRRRVQLAYGLLTPYSVLLLDEITVDLDVLGRGLHSSIFQLNLSRL
jgi:CCR4-NOT complex subunit CAF16